MNQLDRRPNAERASLPEIVFVPLDPLISSDVTRPPQSPWPLRFVTLQAT